VLIGIEMRSEKDQLVEIIKIPGNRKLALIKYGGIPQAAIQGIGEVTIGKKIPGRIKRQIICFGNGILYDPLRVIIKYRANRKSLAGFPVLGHQSLIVEVYGIRSALHADSLHIDVLPFIGV